MYRQLLALSAALLLTLSSSSTEASSSSSTSSSPSSYIRKQPNAYIVELQGRDTNEFFASYPGAKVRYTYDSDILHGASVEFSDPAAAKRALSHKDVVNAWQVGHHTRPSATAGASFHRNDNNNRTLQPLDPDQIQTLTGYSNASRQLNVDGSSVRVGIIDSGVDYRHPALGGCFGTGCRIAYGYDLVGDDYDGSPDSIRPDADPLDDCPAGAGK